MNRWDCSGGDVLCNAATISATTVLFALYAVFAIQNHKQLSRLPEGSPLRVYCKQKRRVFLSCGALHATGKIANYICPIHWIEVLLLLNTIAHTAALIWSKHTIDAVEQVLSANVSNAARHNAISMLTGLKPKNLDEASVALARLLATLTEQQNEQTAAGNRE